MSDRTDLPLVIPDQMMLEPDDAAVLAVRGSKSGEYRIALRFDIDGESFNFLFDVRRAASLGVSIVRMAKLAAKGVVPG